MSAGQTGRRFADGENSNKKNSFGKTGAVYYFGEPRAVEIT